jgi:hypothetical protein
MGEAKRTRLCHQSRAIFADDEISYFQKKLNKRRNHKIVLWGDVGPLLGSIEAPEPFLCEMLIDIHVAESLMDRNGCTPQEKCWAQVRQPSLQCQNTQNGRRLRNLETE